MKVGFIGLGTQGKPLAVNLARSEHDVMVYDIQREPLEELASAGARTAHSNREVGAHGELIEICVLNDAQLEDVVLGPDGVLAGARPGAVIAVHIFGHVRKLTRNLLKQSAEIRKADPGEEMAGLCGRRQGFARGAWRSL